MQPTGEARRSRRGAASILRELASNAKGPDISIGEIAAAFGERSFGLLLIVFSLPNCVPAPPGLGSILGLPVFLIAAQMIWGRPMPWLPRRLRERRIASETFRSIVARADPRLSRLERLIRPRGEVLFTPLMERAVGLFVLLMAAVVMLPFPLTNLVPAVATVIVALALIERDALALAVASLVGAFGVFLASSVILAALKLVFATASEFVD